MLGNAHGENTFIFLKHVSVHGVSYFTYEKLVARVGESENEKVFFLQVGEKI